MSEKHVTWYGPPPSRAMALRRLRKQVEQLRSEVSARSKKTKDEQTRRHVIDISEKLTDNLNDVVERLENLSAKTETDLSLLVVAIDSLVFEAYQAGAFIGPAYNSRKGGGSGSPPTWWEHGRELGKEILQARYIGGEVSLSPEKLAQLISDRWKLDDPSPPDNKQMADTIRKWIDADDGWLQPEILAWVRGGMRKYNKTSLSK